MIRVIFFLTMTTHLCLLLFLLLTLTKVFGELTARGISSTPTVGTVPGWDRTGQDSPATLLPTASHFCLLALVLLLFLVVVSIKRSIL